MTDTAPQSGPTPATVRRAPRWMWVVLVLSVALNLLVLGAAGRAMWHFRGAHHFGADRAGGLTQYLGSLPDARRDEIAGLIEADRGALRALRRNAREKRRALAEAFTADPLDPDRLAAAARAASEARIAMIRQREAFFPRLAEKLTAEERRAYLEWRRENRWRRWHHRRWRDKEEASE